MARTGLIRLGEIVKPHGLKGEVCVACDADSPFVFDVLHVVYLVKPQDGRAEKPQRMKLRGWRLHQNRPMLSLEGVDDRDAAEALRGLLVHAKASDLPPPEEDDVYLHELQGCEVFLESGRRLGRIDHFIFPSAEQEIWGILTDSGREILLPAHPQTVLDIDLDARRVLVAPPEGLLELYLGE
jgi:16S rRNA processing protein RimM